MRQSKHCAGTERLAIALSLTHWCLGAGSLTGTCCPCCVCWGHGQCWLRPCVLSHPGVPWVEMAEWPLTRYAVPVPHACSSLVPTPCAPVCVPSPSQPQGAFPVAPTGQLWAETLAASKQKGLCGCQPCVLPPSLSCLPQCLHPSGPPQHICPSTPFTPTSPPIQSMQTPPSIMSTTTPPHIHPFVPLSHLHQHLHLSHHPALRPRLHPAVGGCRSRGWPRSQDRDFCMALNRCWRRDTDTCTWCSTEAMSGCFLHCGVVTFQ